MADSPTPKKAMSPPKPARTPHTALALRRIFRGARQLTRLFARYLQASPSEVAKTARVQRAKRLIDETSLPMTEIAMRAGFGSLRRFNSVFTEVYGRPPTEIRRKKFSGAALLA